jgi:hypothetical protein
MSLSFFALGEFGVFVNVDQKFPIFRVPLIKREKNDTLQLLPCITSNVDIVFVAYFVEF